MIYQKSQFKITPSPYLTGNDIQVEFTRLDAPLGKTSRQTYNQGAYYFAQGVDVYKVLGTQAGRWKMRARILTPKTGDFSAEVPFQYVMQSPVVTTRPKAQQELVLPGR